MNLIAVHEPNWPVLDRTAYLIEHACVPKSVPTYCAEEGQLFAMLAKAALQNALLEEQQLTH